MPDLTILYRGPLSSCNYDCHYCPFAKHHETASELAHDRNCLERFERWSLEQWPTLGAGHGDRLSIFFTPWGEALIRSWYQKAIIRLTQTSHIKKVAIQTNLSCRLDWIDHCDPTRLGLWCTFHPSQTSRSQFLSQCRILDANRIRYSVGAVGLKEDLSEIKALRQELPAAVYLWINAFKRQPGYYTETDIQHCEQLDPLFRINATYHASRGRPCRTGASVISVDGNGEVTRCHFVKDRIGNLYDQDFSEALRERLCPNDTCGCHIGYVHLDHLNLETVFGDGLLERIKKADVFQKENIPTAQKPRSDSLHASK